MWAVPRNERPDPISLRLRGLLLLLVLGAGVLVTTALSALTTSAGTLGATVVFLAARAGLAGLAMRAAPWVQRLEAGFRRNGLNYLLVLRLIPVFPFWLVNLVPAFLGVRLGTFAFGTFVGIIPGAFVYASLGSGLGALIESGERPDLGIIFQPRVLVPLIGLALLALLPVVYKRLSGRGLRPGDVE